MPIRIGTQNNPSAIYVGATSMSKVYVGNTLVWQKVTNIVEATEISNIQVFQVTASSTILSGGGTIVERGFCWHTSPNPTISNNKVISGSGIGEFTATIVTSTCNTTYYVRAYAKNSADIVFYGEEISFIKSVVLTAYVFIHSISSTSYPGYNVTITSEATAQQAINNYAYLRSINNAPNSSGYSNRFEGSPEVGKIAYNGSTCAILPILHRNRWKIRFVIGSPYRYYVTYIDNSGVLTVYYEHIPVY